MYFYIAEPRQCRQLVQLLVLLQFQVSAFKLEGCKAVGYVCFYLTRRGLFAPVHLGLEVSQNMRRRDVQ